RPLQLLGVASRNLDLSERPQLPRRLPRRLQARCRAEGSGVPPVHRGVGTQEGQGRGETHSRSAPLEFEYLAERLVDEPIPAIAWGAPDGGEPHGRARL